MSIFDLSRLNEQQRAITQQAIDACGFNWELLRPGLKASVGRDAIPVDWSDLSRYGQAAESRASGDGHDHDHDHDGAHHWHIEVDGDKAHVLATRRAALGLAWYSGRISIEQSLVNNPDVAKEVFLAEGAHMIDFFFMNDEQRKRIYAAFHGGNAADDHGHGWFEETGNQDYWSWVGESFMSGFIFAYAPTLPQPLFARQPWAHRATAEIGAQIREILTPAPVEPTPAPEQEYIGSKYGTLYHKPECSRVKRIKHVVRFTGDPGKRRACSVCLPTGSA